MVLEVENETDGNTEVESSEQTTEISNVVSIYTHTIDELILARVWFLARFGRLKFF